MTDEQYEALRDMARWDTQHITSTGEMPRLWYGGVVAAAVAHIDAQAARIRRLDGMVAIWIGFAYERSKVDYATFAAGLTPEELATWRIDPEVAEILDEKGQWRAP
jgi:hypothetical protein